MRSSWQVDVQGEIHRVLPKLERLACFKMEDLLIGRRRADERTITAHFMVTHAHSDWCAVRCDVLDMARRIEPYWQITFGHDNVMFGQWIQGVPQWGRLSRVTNVLWALRKDQIYPQPTNLF